MGKKIEMTEDEFKKIVLILKCSKRYVNLPPNNLFLGNLWRVSSKLADKLLKRNGFQIVKGTGSRYTVKPVEDKKLEIPIKDVVAVVLSATMKDWKTFSHKSMDTWLCEQGWVKVHNNHILYDGYINTAYTKKPLIPISDEQLEAISKYGKFCHKGMLLFGLTYTPCSMAKLEMMEPPMIAKLLDFGLL